MDPAREVAELLERVPRVAPRLGEQRPRGLGIALQLLLGHPDAHAERDEPRLRTVVEVALDPAQLGLLDVDRGRAALLEPLDVVRAPGVDDGGVRAGEQRERQGRPDRPEVAAGRDRPDGDEEAADEHGDPDLDRERLAAKREPRDLRLLEHEDDPAGHTDDERHREQRPDRPEVVARRGEPDQEERPDDQRRARARSPSAPAGGGR